MRYGIVGTVGQWTFYQVTNHDFGGELAYRPLYGFAVGKVETMRGEPKLGELYASLEHAMVAAVGEKYTGPRGASGTGVSTAADWFMRMVGADQLVKAEDPHRVLADAGKTLGLEPSYPLGVVMDKALQTLGYTLARVDTDH
jgi:hypothetical protein